MTSVCIKNNWKSIEWLLCLMFWFIQISPEMNLLILSEVFSLQLKNQYFISDFTIFLLFKLTGNARMRILPPSLFGALFRIILAARHFPLPQIHQIWLFLLRYCDKWIVVNCRWIQTNCILSLCSTKKPGMGSNVHQRMKKIHLIFIDFGGWII